MKLLPTSLCATALALACVAAFATAQTKPAQPAKPSAPAASPAPAAADQKADEHKPGMMHGHAMMAHEAGCPMKQAAPLADVTVQNTKKGAAIQLVAKNAADIAKVQELARELAQHLSMHGAPGKAHMGHGH